MSVTEFINTWLLKEFWQTGAVILSMLLGLGIIRKGGFLTRFILGTAIMWVVTNTIAFIVLCYIYKPT